MSASDVVSSIANSWGVSPASMLDGARENGVGVALWTLSGAHGYELPGAGYSDVHVISIPVSGTHRSTYVGDGLRRWSRAITPWRMNIVPAGEKPHAFLDGCEVTIEYLHIYLPATVLSFVADHSCASETSIELIDPACTVFDPVIAAIGSAALGELRHDQLLGRLRMDTIAQELAIQIVRRYSSIAERRDKASAVAHGGLATWQERRCTEYLRENVAQDVDLTTLAAIANLSPFHFARMFKKTVGVPPHRYQLLLRLERARELLLATERSVLEVALAVGYDAPQTLARLFRREMGVTPSAWRRERRS